MSRVDQFHNAQVAVDLVIEDEGIFQGEFSKINFIGAGVSAEQDGGDPQTCNVTITGGAGVTDHGSLSGLGDDDHPHYQLRSEKGAPNGYVGLNGSSKVPGTFIIYGSSANTACEGDDPRLTNARTPTSHASSHILGAGDPIDSDKLGVDWVPSNYTRNSSPAEVSDLRHLTSHLKGIDVEIGNLSIALTDHGTLNGLSDDDHPQYQLRSEKDQPNGYPSLNPSGKIPGVQITYGTALNTACQGNDSRLLSQTENDAAQGTNGTPSGTNRFVTNSDPRMTNTRDPNPHAANHILGGSDEIDADRLEVDFAPANYVPSTGAPESSDLKHLTSHLKGIDDAFGIIGSADHGTLIGLGDDDHPQYQLRSEKDNAGGYVGLDSFLNAGVNGNLDVGNGLDVTGNITVSGLVDGRDIAVDGGKLDGIESNAKDDQLASEVPYDNDLSGLTATNVQSALDEIASEHTTDHGDLTGLGDDDHPQYQLRSEQGQPNGYPNLSASSKVLGTQILYGNSADTACEGNDPRLSDTRDPNTHANTHINGGTDEIDGDRLEIDFAPTEYTPSTTPPEASDLKDLSAHLSGIDTRLGEVNNLVRIKLRNETGQTLPKGKLLYPSGWSVTHSCPFTGLAEKDDAAKRPAIAITEDEIPNNTTFFGLVQGVIAQVDTSMWALTDQLVLGNNGDLQRPPPDSDPFTGEVQNVGSVIRVDATEGQVQILVSQGLDPLTADQQFAVEHVLGRGHFEGGELSINAGLNVDVTAGVGYVTANDDYKRLVWTASTITLADNTVVFIFVNSSNTVTSSTVKPNLDQNVILGVAKTSAGSIVELNDTFVPLKEKNAEFYKFLVDTHGPLSSSGGVVTVNGANPKGLDVSPVSFYIADLKKSAPGLNGITFSYWYRDGGSNHVIVAGQNSVDPENYDNGSGTLAAVPAGKFKSDAVYVSVNNGVASYHVVYGQTIFDSQIDAEAGDLPLPPDVLKNYTLRLAGVVTQQGGDIISIIDHRPFLGQLGPSATLATDHGQLGGLADDDHPHYQLRSEKDAASGYLGLDASSNASVGGNLDVGAGLDVTGNITVTGTVDGRDVATDGTKLDGIETSADVTDFDNVKSSLAAANTAIDFNSQNFTGVGTVNGVSVEGHAGRHVLGGADEIDGDQLDIDWDPTYYTPSTTIEAPNANHLTSHLNGIDTKFSTGGRIFGDDFQTQSALTRTTTTATTPQVKVSLTTPALTGTYRVGWKAVVDSNKTQIKTHLYNSTDAIIEGAEIITEPASSTERVHVGGFEFITFSGAAKTFELRWYAGAGTAGIQGARLEFWRVA